LRVTPKQLIFLLVFTFLGGYILFKMYSNQSTLYAEEMILKGLDPDEHTLLGKLVDDFKSISPVWLILVLGVYTLSNMFRAWRWKQALEPMGYEVSTANSYFTLMLGYFANLGFPRIGEAARPASLAKYENIEFEKVFGTVVTERVVDVIGLITVILFSLLFEYEALIRLFSSSDFLSDNLGGIIDNPILILVVLLLLPLLGYFIISRPFVKNSRIYAKVADMIQGFWQGIISIKGLKNPWLYVFYSLGIWICYYLMTYLCFFAYQPTSHLGLGEGLLTFLFGTLGMVFPSQGGMGSYHFAVGEALQLYDVSSTDAFSFANIIFFSIQIMCNVFFGILALIILPLTNRNNTRNVKA